MIYKNNIGKEWGSMRLISFLTPDTFTKKIIVISTLISEQGGQTAIAQASAINYLTIDITKLKWETLQLHKNFEEAVSYHINMTNNKKFVDAETIEV